MTTTHPAAPTTFRSTFPDIEDRLGRDAFTAGEVSILVGRDRDRRDKQIVAVAAAAVADCEARGAGTVLFVTVDSSVAYVQYLFEQAGRGRSRHLMIRNAASAGAFALLMRTVVRATEPPAVVFVASLSAMADAGVPAAGDRSGLVAHTLLNVAEGDLDSAFTTSTGLPLTAVNDSEGSAPCEPIAVVAALRMDRTGSVWGSKHILQVASTIIDTEGRLLKARH